MGKDNANTTNSWLNMGKVLELVLTNGRSALTGLPMGTQTDYSAEYILTHLRELFYERLQEVCNTMRCRCCRFPS